MLFGKSKLPLDWPSPLHNKCSKSSCCYPNLPQPAPGTYICVGCGKGNYVVTLEMAIEADAQCRRAFEFQDRNRRKFHAIQASNERRSAERDFARYERENRTEVRREKWTERPGSPLERRPATKRPGSPVARPPLQTTLAIRHTPALIPLPTPPSTKRKGSKTPEPSSTIVYSFSTPNSSKSVPPRCISPKNVLMKCAALTKKTPERVYNPNTYNPNWAAETDHIARRAARSTDPTTLARVHPPPRPRQHDPNLCSRNCPIHSRPKEPKASASHVPASSTRPPVPVRPPRPPTISLSIHSKPSREEIPVAVVNNANYYAIKAQSQAKGYMPHRV
ncbi:MAG: hypothetical protein NXY57DRAFT_448650 [Lentinula lateritia]|uniref:Uncharacterized protein n=1 Tax=Lentinula lateritia TaxID=40482 RepID=A0ABQ8VX99_9AGAR|nr:MAG: hypothetical protein NXY57DRAFT_448650 [Lentinula lateritia]KAJ4500945.1 hypothetical protein C8R41DRAFT_362829 [Lentinula lateritia]